MSKLTAVIPFFNGHATLPRLLDSLPDWLPAIVVDDRSDRALEINRPGVRVILAEEKGYFAGAVNLGLAACETDVLVLNQDVWLEGHDWRELVMGWQGNGVGIGGDGVFNHPAWPKGYVQGTFMYMSRKAIDVVGNLDEQDYPLWGATAEWQLRACRAGFQAVPVKPVPGLGHSRRKRYGSAIQTILKREPHRRELLIRTPPLISMIVPCYNYGRYLPDAVNSLIGGPTSLGDMPGQTLQSFEIIIVDDASTDGESQEIGQSLADAWKGIHYVQLAKNRGTAGALNAGVSRAKGKYIGILSADDMREPWHLETLYRPHVDNDRCFTYCNPRKFAHGERSSIYVLPDYDFEKLLYKNCAGAGIIYPREAWERVGGYPDSFRYGREDWAFNLSIAIRGYCGVKVNATPSNLYRKEGQNRTVRTHGWRHKFLAQLKKLHPDIYAGERPAMACCGGRSGGARTSKRAAQSKALTALPGHKGMVLLEFIGPGVGTSEYRGFTATTARVRYKFGNSDKDRVKFVDKRDVPGFLAMRMKKGKRRLFKKHIRPKPILNVTPADAELANPGALVGVEKIKGLPQDAPPVKATRPPTGSNGPVETTRRSDGELDAGELLELAEVLIEAKTNGLDMTSKAKILAVEKGIDLAAIIGTGKGGKITVRDVRNAAA